MQLTLALTHQCNLRCGYCYAGDKSDRRMTPDTIQKALDLAFDYPGPAIHISVFGGEPLLELELIDRVARESQMRAKQKNKTLQLALTSNGTLLNEQAINLLKKHRFALTISLDGNEKAHNSARCLPDGTGTFRQVVSGIRRAWKRLAPIKVNAVIHPKNAHLLPESFDFIMSLGVERMAFSPDYDAIWSESDRDQYQQAINMLGKRIIDYYRAGHDCCIQPFHTKITSHLLGGFCDADKCSFGCQELAVAPSGRLYPCERLIAEDGADQNDVVIGHVNTGIDLQRVLALKQPKDIPDADCQDCAILQRCMWWCGCVNRSRTGRVDQVDDLLCFFEQCNIQQADHMAAVLFKEKNTPFINRYYLANIAGG